ncbi:MAG: cyclic nucleotide-binding domain-containing protein, partial [Myxococcota bacterium]
SRVGACFPVRLFSSDFVGALSGNTRDLSVDGTCISTTSPFALQSVQRIELMLPGGTLTIHAEGCWQRDEPADDVMLTGLAFRDLSNAARETLWKLVIEAGTELARFLHACPHLEELGLEEAMGLAQVTRFREIPAGRTLYRQDTRHPGQDSIFVVTQGLVVLQTRMHNAREIDFCHLEAGELFGGFPLIADLDHTESAIAETPLGLLEIDGAAYRYIRATRPWLAQRLAAAVLRTSAMHLRAMVERCHRPH